MVLGQVGCPAEIHFATVFALQNCGFLRLGSESPPITPLSVVPACITQLGPFDNVEERYIIAIERAAIGVKSDMV